VSNHTTKLNRTNHYVACECSIFKYKITRKTFSNSPNNKTEGAHCEECSDTAIHSNQEQFLVNIFHKLSFLSVGVVVLRKAYSKGATHHCEEVAARQSTLAGIGVEICATMQTKLKRRGGAKRRTAMCVAVLRAQLCVSLVRGRARRGEATRIGGEC